MATNVVYWMGSYTDPAMLPGAQGLGLTRLRLDPATGRVEVGPSFDGPPNPSYVILSSDGTRMYAVHETVLTEAEPQGAVSTWAVEGDRLSLLNQTSSGGGWPCHLALNAAGTRLAVANYFDGVVAEWSLDAQGCPQGTPTLTKHHGSGPSSRQAGSHAHQVSYDAEGQLWSVDLGTDAVWRGGKPEVRLAPGSGPRHLVWHADHRGFWIVNELAGTVEVWRKAGGRWNRLQATSTLPAGKITAGCAALRLSPDGRFLVASNRAEHHSLVWWPVAADGRLGEAHWIGTGGRAPRDFVIDPTGQWVLVAHQDSGNLVVFRRDVTTGRIEGPVSEHPAPTVVCLALHPAG